MDQFVGKLLDNRYEILECVGVGGMARVYKARCHRLNRLVAIKILREDFAHDAEFRRRFKDESQAVAMLSHPNIVSVYDVSRSSEYEYIVMELIEGITLKQYMQNNGNKLSWREALHFIIQIAKALDHAHGRGIIHRDIKPQNIMVLRDRSVKVADFGIARLTSGGHSTLTQEALGSVHYISPEQAKGSHIDARSDLYSAGVLLYEMLTGRLPFEGDSPVSVAIQHINSIPLSPREHDPSIPVELERITMKAMAPNVDRRYLSAAEMQEDLEAFRKNPSAVFTPEEEDLPLHTEDEFSTQVHYLPASTRQSQAHGSTSSYRPQRQTANKTKNKRSEGTSYAMIAAVGAVFIFVAAMFFFLFNMLSDLGNSNKRYEIPNLVGQQYESLVENKEVLHDFVLLKGEEKHSTKPIGTVLEQDPAAGLNVTQADAVITVVVSAGPEQVEMIDLTNQELQWAHIQLRDRGLSVGKIVEEYDETIEKGKIISHTPAQGALLNPGDKIDVVVSLGSEEDEIEKATVPHCIGLTATWATSKLHLVNLREKITEEYHSTIPAGEIIDQHPLAGEEVPEDSEVILLVSKGPSSSGGNSGSSSPSAVTKIITVQLPNTDEVIQVRVLLDNTVIFSDSADPAMSSVINIDAYASGTKLLQVYFNNEFQYSEYIYFTD